MGSEPGNLRFRPFVGEKVRRQSRWIAGVQLSRPQALVRTPLRSATPGQNVKSFIGNGCRRQYR
jgi:hypothetical protein